VRPLRTSFNEYDSAVSNRPAKETLKASQREAQAQRWIGRLSALSQPGRGAWPAGSEYVNVRTGNPAVIGTDCPVDRRLCVPTFR